MPRPIGISGEIEIFCHLAGSAKIAVGDRVSLVFAPGEGSSPPFVLKVFSPSGATILDTTVRDLPTVEPQSPPPIEIVVSARGQYRIEIRQMRGRQRGEAILHVE